MFPRLTGVYSLGAGHMFPRLTWAVYSLGALSATYLAKSHIEKISQTNTPSAQLKSQSDESLAELKKSGFTNASIQYFEGDYFAAYRAEGRQSAGVLEHLAGVPAPVKKISALTFFNLFSIKKQSTRTELSITFKRQR